MKKTKQDALAAAVAKTAPVKTFDGVLRAVNFDDTQTIEVDGRAIVVFPPTTIPNARVGGRLRVTITADGNVARMSLLR